MAVRMQRRRVRDERFEWSEETLAREHESQHAATLLRKPMREYAELIPEPGFGPLDFALFPYQEAWYSDEVADAEEVVWRKSTQVGMCLAPETRVLTAALRWVPIDEIAVGDRLLAVDETGPDRRMSTAIVQARYEREAATIRLRFADGSSVVGTGEHRWLHQQFASRPWEWCRADQMRVGDSIKRLVRPWAAATLEDAWFGGLLDGEGSMTRSRHGANLVVTQQHGAVYERAVAHLATRGATFKESIGQASLGKPVGRISLSRMADVFMLLGLGQPTRWAGHHWWIGKRMPAMWEDGAAEIVAIERMPRQRVIDLTTSEATFIAEGLVSHNSAYAWRWAVRQADQFGDTVVYIFPTDTHVTEFGDERIEPAIEESPYLKARIRARYVRHKRLKRIGRGFLHLRGSNSKAGAQSVAAQDLVFDEYDYLDQTNLPQIERRITGARQLGKHPRIRRLGTPTIDGDGISAAFESSDQRVWVVTCHECDHPQEVTWEDNVRWRNAPDGEVMRAGNDVFTDPKRVEDVWRACARCDERLDVSVGAWVAQQPDRSVIGFLATRLIVPNTDLKQIVVASRKTKPADVEAFENNDLGRPYSGAEASLDQASLLAACALGGELVHGYVGMNPVTMGVDVAGERDLNVRIDEQLPPEHPSIPNPRRALWIGTVRGFNDLIKLIHAFRPVIVAIDSNPERRLAKALRSTFPPGMVVLIEYDARNVSESIKVDTGEAGTPLEGVPLKARVNRTEAIDAMMDSIRQLRNLPLRNPPPGWLEQMRSLKRKTVLDTRGNPQRVYVTTGTHGDDFAHADVYALVATELWRLRGGANAMVPGERPLPDEELGFRRVSLSGDNPDIYHPGFGESPWNR